MLAALGFTSAGISAELEVREQLNKFYQFFELRPDQPMTQTFKGVNSSDQVCFVKIELDQEYYSFKALTCELYSRQTGEHGQFINPSIHCNNNAELVYKKTRKFQYESGHVQISTRVNFSNFGLGSDLLVYQSSENRERQPITKTIKNDYKIKGRLRSSQGELSLALQKWSQSGTSGLFDSNVSAKNKTYDCQRMMPLSEAEQQKIATIEDKFYGNFLLEDFQK